MLLFLGAGASKPFGIPIMRELSDNIQEEMKPIDTYSIINEIKRQVKNFGIEPDIEAILTCIDALKNPKKGYMDAGPLAAYASKFRNIDSIYPAVPEGYYEKLSTHVREFIRNHCFLPDDEKKITKIEKVYDNLLLHRLHSGTTIDLFVFTTNYDNCFEEYCSRKRYDFFDGFKLMRGMQIFVGMDNPDKSWKICKLHGSSNYVITDRNILVKTDEVTKIGNRITAGRIVKESMIFPTTEKYFSKSPYIELLNCLRKELLKFKSIHKRFGPNFIVIGYSFRDIPINNALIDAFEKGCFQEHPITFVDPNASKIVRENIPELESVINPIDKKFEEITEKEISIW